MCADGQQVDVVLLNVNGNFAHRLHAIHCKENPVFLGNLADFRDGVDHANFIVGVHDGDQNRGRLDGCFQVVQADAAVTLHRQIANLKTMLLQVLASVEHGFVLDRLGNDVVAFLAEHFRDAFDHQVVGFRGAAGEDNLLPRGVDQRGHLLARIFHGFFGAPAEGVVAACRIPELAGEIRHHCLHHTRVDGRGGVIIHVNRQFDGHGSLFSCLQQAG